MEKSGGADLDTRHGLTPMARLVWFCLASEG
jgi:hypothetical protein